jgi:hypothetical protein
MGLTFPCWERGRPPHLSPTMATDTSLTEPLLTDGEEELIGNINAGDSPQKESSNVDGLENNPTDPADETSHESPLQNPAPALEYEPSDFDDSNEAPIKTIKVCQPQKLEALSTANGPVCVRCENCNTTCETTVVRVFGLSTCLWICVLLVLCFPIAWLPLFWKDVSKIF